MVSVAMKFTPNKMSDPDFSEQLILSTNRLSVNRSLTKKKWFQTMETLVTRLCLIRQSPIIVLRFLICDRIAD